MNSERKISRSPRSFDEMPIVVLPEDYATDMPSFLAQMAMEHGPIFRSQTEPLLRSTFGDYHVYMVGPEANKFVMSSHIDHFSHDLGYTPLFALGGFFGKSLSNIDGAEHRHLRTMLAPAFSKSSVNEYFSIINRIVAEYTSDWDKLGEVDIYQEAHKITLAVVAEALMGFQGGGRLHKLFSEVVRVDDAIFEESYEQFLVRSKRTRDEINARLLEVVGERTSVPTNDAFGRLIRANDRSGGAFSTQQVIEQCLFLLAAGLETTSIMSAWLFYLLATHPEYLKRVLEELDALLARTNGEITLDTVKTMKELARALDEVGRLYSPFGNVPRGVVKDFTFGEYVVPTGTQVLLSLAASHRLPYIFQKPDVFDPDRFAPSRAESKYHPYALVTFGGGPRVCLGMNFALVEMKVMAAHILRKYVLAPIEGSSIVHAYYKVIASLPHGIHLHVKRRT